MRSHTGLFAITAALVAAMSMPAVAQAAEAIAVSSGPLRAGPASDFPSVDHISKGDDLEVYGCTDSYSWCDVSDGDNRGWFPGSRIAFMRDGRQEILPEVGAAVGIGIIGFAVGDYWGAHYHSRPFFRQEQTYSNRWHGPGPGGPNRPPVNNPPHVNNQPHVTPHQNTPHVTPQVNNRRVTPQVNTPHVTPHVNTPHATPHANTPHIAPHAPPPIENRKPL